MSMAEARAGLGPLYETLRRFELPTGEVGRGRLEYLVAGTYRAYGPPEPGAEAP